MDIENLAENLVDYVSKESFMCAMQNKHINGWIAIHDDDKVSYIVKTPCNLGDIINSSHYNSCAIIVEIDYYNHIVWIEKINRNLTWDFEWA